MKNNSEKYELVVGLEIHAQLLTKSKAFCGDEVVFGALPNTAVSEISLGHPGTLPVHNRSAVNKAIMFGLACHSKITEFNKYSRKNYFYADLPKGYQITQFDTPICQGGFVTIKLDDNVVKDIELTRIHMEEDTGKSIHDLDLEYSLLDYNRAGTALVELVTEPVIRSSEEAYQFLSEVRKLVRYLDICDGNMEEGSLRCDANISVRIRGAEAFGTKVEVKNMNSISNVKRAIEYEFIRQTEAIENGEEIISETRGFDAMSGSTISMRNKELVNDYRYFPEPDLPPLFINQAWIDVVKASMPKLPKELFEVFTNTYKLSDYDAQNLTEDKHIAQYFIEVASHTSNAKSAANWVMGSVKKWLNSQAKDIQEFPITPSQIAKIIDNIDQRVINNSIAEQQLFPALLNSPSTDVNHLIKEMGLAQESNDDAILAVIDEVLASLPDKVLAYKNGNKNLLGLFMGQIMKKTNGKADPQLTNKLLAQKLNE